MQRRLALSCSARSSWPSRPPPQPRPVDDATAARRFADATLRAQPEIAVAPQQLEALGDLVGCAVDVPRKLRARA